MPDTPQPPQPAPAPKKRCRAYIDGFNLYYGVLEPNPAWKWTNLQSLLEALRPDEDVVAIKYFTALVEPDRHTSPKRDRQRAYFRALATLPKVQRIEGKYHLRLVTCRAAACPRQLQYLSPEEKKTDVNLAVHLIDDALAARGDSFVLVSGDSDLEPAVDWVRKQYPAVKVTVYIPTIPTQAPQRRNDFYLRIGVTCRPLPLVDIPHPQFPSVITLPNGTTVQRPADWR
jgi:uncharacterized LabA/DUF88 family protein